MLVVHNFAHAAPLGQNYAEWSYFDGYAFQHIAAWQDHKRLQRIRNDATKAVRSIERRKGSRARFAA
jgi:hypothetical protein